MGTLNTHGVARGKGCEIPPPEAGIGKKEEENLNHKQQRGVKEKKIFIYAWPPF